jgi:Protein of unknown function (DUF4054)
MSNPVLLTFDVDAFRIQFPAYASTVQFPDATLQAYWDSATCYMSDVGNYGSLQGTCRQYGLNLLTAHLAYISQLIASGQVPYVLGAATIDKVQITAVPPPLKTQFGWWLSISPYGQQLWALLQANIVGGFYIGGSPILSSFRGYGRSGYAIPN